MPAIDAVPGKEAVAGDPTADPPVPGMPAIEGSPAKDEVPAWTEKTCKYFKEADLAGDLTMESGNCYTRRAGVAGKPAAPPALVNLETVLHYE